MAVDDILEARGLNKAYGGLQAVRNCTFTVERGSITSLIGPNGAGKTTAFDLINGVVVPDSGQVIFDGVDVTGRLPHTLTRMGMSRTFQITRDLRDMTVLENMVVSSPARGWRTLVGTKVQRHEKDRAMDLLDFVGISHLAHTPADRLSYGQRKLLEFASDLMSDRWGCPAGQPVLAVTVTRRNRTEAAVNEAVAVLPVAGSNR